MIVPILLIFFLMYYFFNYINQIYQIIRIFFDTIKIKNYIINNKFVPKLEVLEFKNRIDKIGVFAIKLIQWSNYRLKLTINNEQFHNFLNNLNIYYENCQYHSFEYTEKIYMNEFKSNILDDYKIEKIPVASGSIGQVYECYDNNNNKVALKCIHPNIKKSIKIPKFFFKIFNEYLTKIPFLRKYKIPIDFSGFFDSLEKQMNMNTEAINLKKMYELYENNPYIIIPKLYKNSENILIMSYEEGTAFSDINNIWPQTKKSLSKKFQLIGLLTLFVRSTLIIDGFMHGDLHTGNWKISTEKKIKDLHPIIIYDFGICVEIPKKYINDLIYAIDSGDKELIINAIFSDFAIANKCTFNKEQLENIKIDILKNLGFSSIGESDIQFKISDVINVISLLIEKQFIFNHLFITLIVTMLLITDHEMILVNDKKILENYSDEIIRVFDYDGLKQKGIKNQKKHEDSIITKNNQNQDVKDSDIVIHKMAENNQKQREEGKDISNTNQKNEVKNNNKIVKINNKSKYYTLDKTYPTLIRLCKKYNIFLKYSELMEKLKIDLEKKKRE